MSVGKDWQSEFPEPRAVRGLLQLRRISFFKIGIGLVARMATRALTAVRQSARGRGCCGEGGGLYAMCDYLAPVRSI